MKHYLLDPLARLLGRARYVIDGAIVPDFKVTV